MLHKITKALLSNSESGMVARLFWVRYKKGPLSLGVKIEKLSDIDKNFRTDNTEENSTRSNSLELTNCESVTFF